ncbi:MAG: RNA polymerase sigma factor [Saprospiraceae bacterium]
MANSKPDGWTDTLLIREIRAGGDRRGAAWAYIVRAWRGYYLAPVLRDGGTPEQVDEVLWRVVLDVDKQIRRPDFQLRTATLRTYFTESVYRAWRRSRSKPGNTAVEFDPQVHAPGTDDSPEDDYLRRERVARLDALLTHLGEPCKTVLTMFYLEDRSMREIAEKMGWTNEQTAKNKKNDCYKKLRDLTKNLQP